MIWDPKTLIAQAAGEQDLQQRRIETARLVGGGGGIKIVAEAETVEELAQSGRPIAGTPIDIAVNDGRPDQTSLVFHVPLPAASWWNDIGYT